MAKGVYLNDIPMDLFLKYFTKEDLQDRLLEPSLTDDIRNFYKYTVTISSTDYTHYSIYSDDDGTSVDDEVLVLFADLFPGIVAGDIDSIAAVGSGDLTDAQAYLLREQGYVVPNKFTFELLDGSEIYRQVEVNGSMAPAITASTTGVTIEDYRTEATVVSGVSSFDLVRKDANSSIFYFEVYDGSTLVGYLRFNETSQIQKVNSSGRRLYINEAGNETTEFIRRSNFLRHNRAIRKGVFAIQNPIDIIPLKFNPRTIGLYKSGADLTLAFYENFNRTVTYKRVSPSGFEYTVDRLGSSIYDEIPNVNDTHSVSTVESKIREIENISDFRRIRAIKAGDTFHSVGENDYFISGEKVIVESYTKRLSFDNYPYFAVGVNNLVSLESSGDLANLQVKRANNGLEYLRLPVVISSGAKKVALPGGKFLDLQQTQDGKVKYFIYKGNNYLISTDPTDAVANSRYPYGFIEVRVGISYAKASNDNEYIGVANSNGRSSTLNKYTPSANLIGFTGEFFEDYDQYTESSGVYTKVRYIRDEVDPLLFVEITEEVEKQTPSSTPSLTEFIDYEHTVVTSGEDFTLLSGVKVDRGTAVSTYGLLSKFTSRFSQFNHYASNRYYESRGELVRDNVISTIRRQVMVKMITEYMALNSDFYASVGIFYSSDALMKMRIVSDGFYSVISNSRPPMAESPRKLGLGFSDLKPSLLFYRVDPSQQENFETKQYSGSDFLSQMLDVQDEISRTNAFQRIFDYEVNPYNQRRKTSLFEQKKREKIFSDSTSSTAAKDFVAAFNKRVTTRPISRLDFRRALSVTMSEFFFDSNAYDPNNYYASSFQKYMKGKLENLDEPSYNIETSSKVQYKSLVSRSELSADTDPNKYDEIISRIISDDDDWRLI